MLAAHLTTVLPLLPATIFSGAMITHFSSYPPGRELLTGLGLGGEGRKLLEFVLVVATIFLAFPAFRVAGVVLACATLVVLATAMLVHSKYDYAVPMLIAIGTLPCAAGTAINTFKTAVS